MHSIPSGRRASSPSEYTAMGSTARANWGALSFVLASDQLENKSFMWAIRGTTMPEGLSDFFVKYSPKLPIWAQTKEKFIH